MKKPAFKKIGVIGGGSWGTTLASLLAEIHGSALLWVRGEELCEKINRAHENPVYLPGFKLPRGLEATTEIERAVSGAEILVFVVPSQYARGVLERMAPFVSPETILVSATKGIENKTLKTMAELFRECLPHHPPAHQACLSGPSFAKEVMRKMPTAVTAACHEPKTAQKIQQAFSSPAFRVYTNPDITGVELAGALKNVTAIAAGVSDGMGFGHNTRATLITRGLAEMVRLGTALGANPSTFYGLAGVGDLILTCTGDLSRNRTVGVRLGKGETLLGILDEMKMVAEGVKTTKSAHDLARKYGIEMPIVEQVYLLLYKDKDARTCVKDLMLRTLKAE